MSQALPVRPAGGSPLPLHSHAGTVCAGMRGPQPTGPKDGRPPRGPKQPSPPHPKDPDALPAPKDDS